MNTGNELNVFKSTSDALLGVVVESGYEGDIKVYFAGKTSWHVAEIISCITFVLISAYSITKRKKCAGQNNENA